MRRERPVRGESRSARDAPVHVPLQFRALLAVLLHGRLHGRLHRRRRHARHRLDGRHRRRVPRASVERSADLALTSFRSALPASSAARSDGTDARRATGREREIRDRRGDARVRERSTRGVACEREVRRARAVSSAAGPLALVSNIPRAMSDDRRSIARVAVELARACCAMLTVFKGNFLRSTHVLLRFSPRNRATFTGQMTRRGGRRAARCRARRATGDSSATPRRVRRTRRPRDRRIRVARARLARVNARTSREPAGVSFLLSATRGRGGGLQRIRRSARGRSRSDGDHHERRRVPRRRRGEV